MGNKSNFLRADAEIIRTGPREFLIIDRHSNHRFRIGEQERRLLDLLQHDKSLDDVLVEFHDRYGETLSEQHLQGFVQQLWQANLLRDVPPPPRSPDSALAEPVASSPAGAKQSAADATPTLNFRFDLLAVLFGWILHPLCLLVLAVLVWMAAQIVFRYWPIGLRQLADLFEAYPFPVFVLWFVIPKLIVLNLTQALLTGMACRCFGGRVRGFGLVWWEGIVPLFQADLGNSLAFMDRRGRLTMIWLGLLSPVFIGAASIVGWIVARSRIGMGADVLIVRSRLCVSYPLSLQYFFHALQSLSGFVQRVPELGSLYRRAGGDAVVARAAPAPQALSDRQRRWYRIYGVTYSVYRVLLMALVFGLGGYWVISRYHLIGTVVVAAVAIWLSRKHLWPGSLAVLRAAWR